MSLLLGEMDPNFPGETGLDSPGDIFFFEMYWGSDSIECLIYRRGTIFRSRLPGTLVKNVYMLLGNVEICWRILNFLKV